ncbi:MAG: rhomboid family intramembrane serine protease [Saprospiraceae bacterium]
MIIPIGDDNIKHGHRPVFSYLLLIANAGIFLWHWNEGPDFGRYLYQEYGIIPSELLQNGNAEVLLTSAFLHGGWMHLLGNLLFLWIFADNIEAVVGNFRFILFYIAGAAIAGLIQVFTNPMSDIPIIGASGAISAVMGAYLVMFPHSRVRLLFFIFSFYVPAFLFLVFWIGQQIMSGMAEFGAAGGGVAWWAHIGGFFFGVWRGWRWRHSLAWAD